MHSPNGTSSSIAVTLDLLVFPPSALIIGAGGGVGHIATQVDLAMEMFAAETDLIS